MLEITFNDLLEKFEKNIVDNEKTIEKKLEEDDSLYAIFNYYKTKYAIVDGNYKFLKDCFEDISLIGINYNILEDLLNEENFSDVFHTNLKETIGWFSYCIRNIADNTDYIPNEDDKSELKQVINNLLGTVNDNRNFNLKNKMGTLKKLLLEEKINCSEFIPYLLISNKELLEEKYRELLNKEFVVFIMYYLFNEDDGLYEKSVLKTTKPYLKKIANLHYNFKNYNVFERNTRIRE